MTEELTRAERRVLDAMRDVRCEADAAELLNLSPHTVHTTLRNVRSKLGVRSTRQAISAIPRSGVAVSG